MRATDAGESDGRHFLVMEYVEGVDLDESVRRNGPMSVRDAVEVVRQTARGPQYAHEQGLVHRDIKPSNLMLAGESPSRGAVKILDLGLARLEAETAADAETQANLTMQGSTMGTVDYMSPEQAVDTHAADARSDVYSLGCTLYFLLTGRSPYLGRTVMERLVAHREQPIPALADAANGLQSLFAKMVAKKPEERLSSMAEVVDAIAQLDPELLDATRYDSATIVSNSVVDQLTPTISTTKALTDPQTAESPTATPPRTVSKRTKLAIWSTAATLMVAGIIYFAFDKSRWTVETTGDGVEVSTDDGSVVARDKQTGTTVKVDKDGNATVAAKGNRNTVKIGDNEFEITRDGKVILKGVEGTQIPAPDGRQDARQSRIRRRRRQLRVALQRQRRLRPTPRDLRRIRREADHNRSLGRCR